MGRLTKMIRSCISTSKLFALELTSHYRIAKIKRTRKQPHLVKKFEEKKLVRT